MNRTQKKCVIAATGFHLLMIVILFVGPAFRSERKIRDVPFIDFVPVHTVEALVSGGGNPRANPLPPSQPPPQPPPSQPRAAEPEQQLKVEPVRVVKPATDSFTDKPQKPKVQISTKLVDRSKTSKPATKPAQPETDNRRQISQQVNQAIAGLRNTLAPTTTIELRGPGGGGETYANFYSAILSAYDRAWIAPEGMNSSEAVVDVRVIVESDGSVSSARITEPSGDPRVDRSVQQALDRVKFIPMPAGASRRTVDFTMRTKAKQAI